MQIFWRLILAHLLADFTLQTDFIAAWKRKNVWGVIAHSCVFFLCSAALCYDSLTEVWVQFGRNVVIQGWVAITLLTVLHFLEDEWRVWTIKKLNSQDSFIFFIWDQFIHYILIYVVSPQQNGFYPEKGVLLAIMFVLATHFTTILIFYIERDILGSAKMPVGDKYYAMAERIAVIVALMLPGWWLAVFPAVWLARIAARRLQYSYDFTWLNTVVSGFMAILFGIFARLIYYA